MVTFNDMLRQAGLDPRDVILVRHSGRGVAGVTPHDLWKENGDRFDRYQSTQEAGKPIFRQSTYWASFVGEPGNSTLFVGLYEASLDDNLKIDWLCPLSGETPGKDVGQLADLYKLTLQPQLAHLRGRVRIAWNGSERSWVQYAHRNDKAIEGQITVPLAQSAEGQRVWKMQVEIERALALAKEAKRVHAAANGGSYVCAACDFGHVDPGMFDAHHLIPLAAGERTSTVEDFAILCPTCHRRAHRSSNRLMPYSVEGLRCWNASGRPQ